MHYSMACPALQALLAFFCGREKSTLRVTGSEGCVERDFCLFTPEKRARGEVRPRQAEASDLTAKVFYEANTLRTITAAAGSHTVASFRFSIFHAAELFISFPHTSAFPSAAHASASAPSGAPLTRTLSQESVMPQARHSSSQLRIHSPSPQP